MQKLIDIIQYIGLDYGDFINYKYFKVGVQFVVVVFFKVMVVQGFGWKVEKRVDGLFVYIQSGNIGGCEYDGFFLGCIVEKLQQGGFVCVCLAGNEDILFFIFNYLKGCFEVFVQF